jgi:large subunit ribosomal protein L14e
MVVFRALSIGLILSSSQALVDGPTSGVPRQAMNFKGLVLTDFKVKIQHGCRTKAVRKAVQESDVDKKWEETAWAKKLRQRKVRRSLSDFDRYKVKVLKQKKSRIVRTAFNKLKKAQKA